jgi:hypothetical protein
VANHDVSHCWQTVFEVNHANVSLISRKPRVYSGITFLALRTSTISQEQIVAKDHACAVVAVFLLTAGSPALAQSRAWEGSVFPVLFDSQGVRHYYTYAYYGPFVPPLASVGDEQAVALRRASLSRTVERVVEHAAGHARVVVTAVATAKIPAAPAPGREREADLKPGRAGTGEEDGHR